MMAGAAARDIPELFDGLLDPEVVDAYVRLRARDGCPKDQAEDLVGAALVDVLIGWGMAHVRPHTPADPAWLEPASPDLALAACSRAISTGSLATRSVSSTGSGACPPPRPGSASA